MPPSPPAIPRFFEASPPLPTLPEVASSLLGTLGRDAVWLADGTVRVAQDSALAARLLRLANSPCHRPLQRITRLQNGAAVIGQGPLRAAALGDCLAQDFPRVAGFDRFRFWRLNPAPVGDARWLADRLHHGTDRAEMAGLLLRCGKAVAARVSGLRSAAGPEGPLPPPRRSARPETPARHRR